MEYSSREVNQLLKQYEMFLSSLKLIKDRQEQKNIYFQMTKLIEKIFELTDETYLEKYNLLINATSYLMSEEISRLKELIALIEEREKYVNEKIKIHQEVTGELLKMPMILGEDKVDTYRQNIKIINKYIENMEKVNIYNKEIASLNKTLTEVVKRIKYNDSLNKKLEEKMISLLRKNFEKFELYKLLDSKEEIEDMYYQLSFAYKTAKDNVLLAKEKHNDNLIIECDAMLSKVALEYEEIKEKKNIIEIINTYEDSVATYKELINKREHLNSLVKELSGNEIYDLIYEELDNQFKIIKLESQDIKTYDSLIEEKEKKNKLLFELEEENNSEEFVNVLKELIENEKKYQEQLLLEQRRKEYEENQRRLIEDRKLQEERLKRKKLIDEERKKEQEKRYQHLFNQQKTSTLNKKIEKEPEMVELAKEKIVAKPVEIPNDNVFENILKEIEIKVQEEREKEARVRETEIPKEEPKEIKESVKTISKEEPNEFAEVIPIIKNVNLKAEVIDNKEILVKPIEEKEAMKFPELEPKLEKKEALSGNMGDFKFKNWFN